VREVRFCLYGPFREALDSASRGGREKTDPIELRDVRDTERDVSLDEAEGADVLLVKPAPAAAWAAPKVGAALTPEVPAAVVPEGFVTRRERAASSRFLSSARGRAWRQLACGARPSRVRRRADSSRAADGFHEHRDTAMRAQKDALSEPRNHRRGRVASLRFRDVGLV
jgi:hypothetical protein